MIMVLEWISLGGMLNRVICEYKYSQLIRFTA